jgi:CHAT domain-containing protein
MYDGVANWPRLEAAEAEAAKFVQDNPTTLTILPRLSDVAACLEGVTPVDLLHVALHGQSDPVHGEDGLVLLEPDGDGVKVAYLTALAVRGLRENRATTPFVFLNACQVGAADKVLGSFAGFAAAVLRTKASGVVAPLWNIDDKVAARLSGRFYQATFGPDAVPVAEVLRTFRAEFTLEAVEADPDGVTPTYVAYQFFGHPRFTIERPR